MRLRLKLMFATVLVATVAISDEYEIAQWPYERATEVVQTFLPEVIAPGEITLTFRSSLGTRPEEIVLINSDDEGNLVAELIRAAGNGFVLQLRKALEAKPDLVSGTDYPEIEYLRWRLSHRSCSKLKSVTEQLVGAVEADTREFRMAFSDPKPKSESSLETLMIRADGPMYTLRMMPFRSSWIVGSEIEIDPGPDTRIEVAIEAFFREIDVCTRQTPGQTLRK